MFFGKMGKNEKGNEKMNQEILNQVKEIIVEYLGVEEEQVVPEATLMDNLGADSLDLVELSMNLEEKFGVTIDDEDIGNLKTVGDVVAYLEKNQK